MRSVYQATTTVPSLSNVNLVLVLETARHPGIITLSHGFHLCTFKSQLSDAYTYQCNAKFRHFANIQGGPKVMCQRFELIARPLII